MTETIGGKALRMRQDRDGEDKPKRYKHTYRAVIEGDEKLLFSCDVVGHVTSNEICFLDGTGEASFSVRPNRKIMPTQWLVAGSSGREIGRVTQKILGKGIWVGFDASGAEVFRLVDYDSRVDKVGKSLFGGSSSRYGIAQGNRLMATIAKEPREQTTKKGLRGLIQTFATPSDWVIRFSPDAKDLDVRLILPAMVLLIDFTVAMDSAS